MFDVVAIGQRMKARREQIGLTLDEVAARTGITKATISRYENGVFSRLKLPVLESISRALDMDPSDLLDPDGSGIYVKPSPQMNIPAYLESLSDVELFDLLQDLTAELAKRRKEK